MSPLVVTGLTVLFIALSAFFVAAEFALLAAKTHRLEAMAEHSASARAAVRNARELSLLLAGSQLGITACTLALGAVTKPAVHYALTPLFVDLGLPSGLSDAIAFVLALFIVTFLHLVVGEMAPKSWAIAHPEESASLLSIPMRIFMWFTRPLLKLLNVIANWMVSKAGATPVETLEVGHDPRSLRALVEHSAEAGTLEGSQQRSLDAALTLADRRIEEVIDLDVEISWVDPDATSHDLRREAARSGHLRLVVREGDRFTGVVHVRDALAEETDARALARPVLEIEAGTPVHEALATMQSTSTHLAVVTSEGQQVGVVSINDIVPSLLPR
ncbi:hemolysin family protein [Alteromonas gracilis]